MITTMKGIFGILHLLSIPPEIVGIVKVSRRMGGITKEVIESLIKHESRIIGITTKSRLSN